MPRKYQISEEVMDVLNRSTITATTLKLPEQLDRDLYAKVAKVITLQCPKNHVDQDQRQ